MVIGLDPERVKEYKAYPARARPEVLETIRRCNIRNYSIYYKDGYLFSYFEYLGDNFETHMAMMAADLRTQQWWRIVKPMQRPLASRRPGQWWAQMEEVFHMD